MLTDVREDEVVADRGDQQQPRFAELALDIELAREAVAAVGVDGRVRGVPRRLRREELGHVRFGAAFAAVVEQPRGLVAHQRRGLETSVRLRERELHALIRADRLAEDDAPGGVRRGALYEPS